jgi:trigger factor
MEINVVETEYCKLHVTYEANEEQIDSKKTEVLTLFKKAPVPGFRKGKASLDAIRHYYKSQIDDSLKRALAEEAFHNTVFEKSIKPYGSPDFKSVLLLNNKFSCEFDLHKKPDFELTTYKDFEIPKPVADYTVETLAAKLMEELRIRSGEVVPYAEEDFVQEGDSVIINYDVFDGEENLPQFAATGEVLTVGKGKLPGFDTNLLGMKVGEQREFLVRMPEGSLPELVGKDLKFAVTINGGQKIIPMPLNDELAKKLGKENFAEVQEYITGTATSRIAEAEKGKVLAQVSAKLVAENTMVVPDWLKLAEAQYLAQQSRVDWNTLDDEAKEGLLKTAEPNVKLSLILDRIREVEPEAQLGDQEIIEMIKASLTKSSGDVDDMLKNMNQNGYLPVLVGRIRDENTLDFVLKASKIIE